MSESVLSKFNAVIKSFMPRDDEFFTLLVEGATYLKATGEALEQLCHNDYDANGNFNHDAKVALLATIKTLEHSGDEFIKRFHAKLEAVFITPFDKADLLDLADGIENIIDACHATASLFTTHQMDRMPNGAAEFSALIAKSTQTVLQCFMMLSNRSKFETIRNELAAIKIYEKNGDALYSSIISALFNPANSNVDLQFIRAREFIEALEETLNLCFKMANVLNAATIKNS